MKNTIGQAISVTLFGESHGAAVGAVIDGLAPGIGVDTDYILKKMELRRPSGEISTARVERDIPEIVSGVYNGVTTGTPICIIIRNTFIFFLVFHKLLFSIFHIYHQKQIS